MTQFISIFGVLAGTPDICQSSSQLNTSKAKHRRGLSILNISDCYSINLRLPDNPVLLLEPLVLSSVSSITSLIRALIGPCCTSRLTKQVFQGGHSKRRGRRVVSEDGAEGVVRLNE